MFDSDANSEIWGPIRCLSIIFLTCIVFMAVPVSSVYPRCFFSSASLFWELENKKIRVDLVWVRIRISRIL
jgi:hypothetical protein